MSRLSFAASGSLKPLLLSGALASTLLVAACGPRPAAAPAATPAAPQAAPVTAQTVTRGDIQQTLSYSGDIRAREQVSVLPKATGRVEQVLVDIGSKVKAGDPIAILDQDNPQAQILLARATLAQAQAKMASLQSGPRTEDVASAKAAVAQQQARLQNMRTGGRSEDIKSAEAGLAAAEAKMAALMNGADDGVRQAQQSAVDSDNAALASAQAAFAALGASNAASLQNAQSQVDSIQAQINTAQAQIASADAALANLTGSAAADVQAAQSAYEAALAQLQTAQAALKQDFNPTQAAIAQAQASVEAAKSQRAAAEAQQTALEQNVSGACTDAVVNGMKISHNKPPSRLPRDNWICSSAAGRRLRRPSSRARPIRPRPRSIRPGLVWTRSRAVASPPRAPRRMLRSSKHRAN
jgi:multidrug efflux pump subunit AcrA (membrane-fusion protein)